MLFLGSSNIASNGYVTLNTPQFGAAHGVRLTNYTPSILVIADISPKEPTQQYLLPLQQNIFSTKSVGKLPVIQDVSVGTSLNTSGVLVEWSTDPASDFAGLTYPTTVSNGGNASPSSSVYQLPLAANGAVVSIPGNPFRTEIVLYNRSGGSIKWSTANAGWNANPTILNGDSRILHATSQLYLQPQADNLYLEINDMFVTPIVL
jgi:hypothetical protein